MDFYYTPPRLANVLYPLTLIIKQLYLNNNKSICVCGLKNSQIQFLRVYIEVNEVHTERGNGVKLIVPSSVYKKWKATKMDLSQSSKF